MKIIAEIAQGYEGKPEQALLLARAGVATGADVVKFQCVYGDEIAVPGYKYHAFFKTLEMPQHVWGEIAAIVKTGGRELILNVGGERSLEMAIAIGASTVKFHATSFFCDDLIAEAKKRFGTIYVSIGGLAIEEIEAFIARHRFGPGDVAFTYGFQASPTPVEKNNLRKLGRLIEHFPGFAFGFEDHTDCASPDRFVVPLMALGFGIQHVEKHLTLDPLLRLEDAESALSITDFAQFVEMIRRLEPALGTGDWSLTEVEQDYRKRVLKVAVAARDLSPGDTLDASNTALRRVGDLQGTSIHHREEIYGKTVSIAVPRHAQLTPEVLQDPPAGVVVIETPRFRLRTLGPEDATDRYLGWFSDDDTRRFIDAAASTSRRRDLETYLSERAGRADVLFLGIFDKVTGLHIGNIKYEPVDSAKGCAVMGILIGDREFRGKGVTGEVLTASAQWLRDHRGIRTIVLGVHEDNRPAIRAYEKVGFQFLEGSKSAEKGARKMVLHL